MYNLVWRNNSIFDRYLHQDCFLVARICRGMSIPAIGCHVCIDDKALLDTTLDIDFIFTGGKSDVSEAGKEHAVSIREWQ